MCLDLLGAIKISYKHTVSDVSPVGNLFEQNGPGLQFFFSPIFVYPVSGTSWICLYCPSGDVVSERASMFHLSSHVLVRLRNLENNASLSLSDLKNIFAQKTVQRGCVPPAPPFLSNLVLVRIANKMSLESINSVIKPHQMLALKSLKLLVVLLLMVPLLCLILFSGKIELSADLTCCKGSFYLVFWIYS